MLLADKIAVSPVQISDGIAVGVIIGAGFTETFTVAVPVHPAADPVTV